jgi:nucleotide-binding universal stress UspA family protein
LALATTEATVPKTLIVPVDGSKAAEHALACAQRLAAHLEACDLVVMTVDLDDGERRRDYVNHLAGRVAGVPLRAECVTGDPAAAIIRMMEQEPDAAVCMATHARGRVAGPLLGSVATEVVRGTRVPVLLVGPRCEMDWWHEPAQLVACWVGSGSHPILQPAREWSTELGMDLSLLGVFHPLDLAATVDPRAQFAPALAHLDADHDHIRTVALQDDFPAGAIVQYAKDLPATTLALTTRARTGLGRTALGSAAMEIVHRSPCPMLVVRGPR